MFKISIIIPIYNVSYYIENCLNSVLKQTYENVEFVLVDDASPDDSLLKVEAVLEKVPDKNVKICRHEVNQGLSAARNTGVKASTGDYIYFLDSDDEISSDCIETLASCVTEDFQPDVVMGEMMTIGADRKKYPQLLLSDGCVLRNEQILTSFLKREWYEMACNKLVRRELFFEKGCWFYEGIVHEDNLWSFYLARYSTTMVISKSVTYRYNIHPNTITSKKKKISFDSMLIVINKMIMSWNEAPLCQYNSLFCAYLLNLKFYFVKSLLLSSYESSFVKEKLLELKLSYDINLFREFKMSFCIFIKNAIANRFIVFLMCRNH